MRARRCGSTWLSTWAAVVPELRNTVSPGCMSVAAARAIRCFSSALARTLLTYSGSSTRCCLRMAPPWVVREDSRPLPQRSRSRRMVISDTARISLPRRDAASASLSISRMRPCLSAGNISRIPDDGKTPRGCGVLSQSRRIERTSNIIGTQCPMSSVHLCATARRPGKPLRGRCGLAPSAAPRPSPARRVAATSRACGASWRVAAGGATPPPALIRWRSIVGVGGLHLAFERRVDERRVGEDDGHAYEGDDEHHLRGSDAPRRRWSR